MATIPRPRSYSQIVGDQLDTFLSLTGLPSTKVGDPHLSFLEASAQSDLRNSQDIFNLLNSKDLSRARGQALDRIGADEDAPRFGESPASGLVTITDTSFTKVESKIFQGLPPPIVGSDKLYVASALDFPASGEVYVGRGTGNYEGPLTYTSKTDNTNYWTLNLDTGSHTTRYHNLGESVVLAQGGNRLVTAGTIVQTSQGNSGTAIQFALLYPATIPDGETSIDSVTVVARTPGVIGNAPATSITGFGTLPFTGATVTNPLPYSNGLSTEEDDIYRERIRDIRQSRSRGTALAVKTFTTGLVSTEENKRVISSSVVTREGFPTTLYIDDGTGYEEKDIGISIESVVDEALGGEQYFQLVYGRPVAKAYAEASLQSPYNIVPGSTVSVLIGGVRSEHTFDSTEFRNIASASSYEVVASINGNEDLLFSARTTQAGKSFAVFAKADTNEDVEVVSPAEGFIDANLSFGISAGKVDTLRLYKNDRLLSKDGQLATVTGQAQGLWAPLSSPATFSIRLDGVDVATTPANTYSLTDADFINAGTGYVTLSHTNSLESWAKVLNYKIPGLTAAVSGGSLTLTSNRGRSSVARVEIFASDLVTKGLFLISDSTGKSRDYTLNRNLGQGRLEDSLILHASDRLTAGSIATRAFLETEDLGSITLASAATTVSGDSGAELWFAVDGAAEIISTGITTSTPITLTLNATTTFKRVRITHTSGLAVFSNVQVGDWVLLTDSSFNVANRGAFRVAARSTTYVDVERPTTWATAEAVTLSSGGFVVVRTAADLQRVYIPAGTNYTALSLATSINTQLRGATATLYRTNRFRVRTNTFLTGGDIALVEANIEGRKLTLEIGDAVSNQTTHLAAAIAGHPEAGTPAFTVETLNTVTSSTVVDVTSIGSQTADRLFVSLKSLTDSNGTRSSNPAHSSSIEVISGTTITLRRPAIKEWLPSDRVYSASHYAITGEDELTVVLDGDTSSRRFVVPMFRRLKPGSSTFGITNDFKDRDNANASLATAFGLSMDWRDFAVFMPARTKSHRIAGVDTNQTLLWRYKRLGAEGNQARIQYIYPTAADQAPLASVSALNSAYTEVFVRLPSGNARTGVTYQNSTKLGYRMTAGPTAGLYTYTYVLNLPISTATRRTRLNFTAHTGTWANGTVVTGGTSGATGTISSSFPGAGDAVGYLVLTGIAGTFTSGETITSAGNTATADGTQYGVSELTLTLPTGVTNHGFQVGNSLHVQYNGTGTGAGFLTSAPTINVLEVTATTISYIEGTTAIGATANCGTVSYDTVENKTTGSTVVVGDIFSVGASTSLPVDFQLALRIQTLADGYLQAESDHQAGAVDGTLLWDSINAMTNISWYPISGSTIVAIAAAVNAQGASSPVTAVVVGDGAGGVGGSVTYATYEDTPNGLGGTDPWYYFTDGINYVRSNTNPVSVLLDYNFTFKTAITSSLALNSDWLNEDIRIVPITTENFVDYLNTAGPGGLFANGEITAAGRGDRPQLATLTVGSEGSVQVQGGTANSISAAVAGSAVQVASTYSVLTVNYSDAIGISGGHWMKLENSLAVPKDRVSESTDLESLAADGTVVWGNFALDYNTKVAGWTVGETITGATSGATATITSVSGGAPGAAAGTIQIGNVTGTFIAAENLNGSTSGLSAAKAVAAQYQSGSKAWEFANTSTLAPITGRVWQFEKQGDFVCIQYVSGTAADLTGVQEGDWIHVSALVSSAAVSSRNQGFFRIVRVNNTTKTVWIENSNVLEESATADLAFLTYDSILPGDKLVIGTTSWGTNNLGTWTVSSIDLSTYKAGATNNGWKFSLDVTTRTPEVITGPGPGPLDTEANLVRVVEAQASHLIKRVHSISVNPTNSALADIKFDTWAGSSKAGEAAGTIVKSLDKLNFSPDLAQGIDAYRHTTGLIEEANRVNYGVDSDPSTYPGVIAAGANINIQGPLVHRVQVSLALRRAATAPADIKNQVRSAVAAVINKTGVGTSISISDLVAAAQSVNGVIAVTVLSPTFGAGHDLISIQPYEKPLVLNLDEDVLISFVGE